MQINTVKTDQKQAYINPSAVQCKGTEPNYTSVVEQSDECPIKCVYNGLTIWISMQYPLKH
jgi:hypothetical protein